MSGLQFIGLLILLGSLGVLVWLAVVYLKKRFSTPSTTTPYPTTTPPTTTPYPTSPPIPSSSTFIVGKNSNAYYTTVLLPVPTWVLVPNSSNILDIRKMNDGRLLCVGTDNQLYTKDSISSPMVLVPNSGTVKTALQLNDGTFLGVGTDNRINIRATLTSTWTQTMKSPCCVSCVVQLSNGTLVGSGTDGQLYTKESLDSAWVLVPNSGATNYIVTTNDGIIVCKGTSGTVLYYRKQLTDSWTTLDSVPSS
jgi:hypothetical protein